MEKFFYLPDTDQDLRLTDLSEHQYYGDDYVSGKATVAIFHAEDGSLRAVWTYNGWSHYKLTKYAQVSFEHTQTEREVNLYFVGIAAEDAEGPSFGTDSPVPQWTLK